MINPQSPMKTKYYVKPIAFSLFHQNAYQGPCRYGEGYALTYEYDVEVGNRQLAYFKENLNANIDTSKIELSEPVMLHWCEDFVLSEELFKEALKDDDSVDFYLLYTLRISNLFTVELAKRTSKPIGLIGNSKGISRVGDVDPAARLHAMNRECYSFFDYSDIMPLLDALRVKKELELTRILYPLKGDPISAGCQSSFMSPEDVSKTFGVSFCYMDAMQVLDMTDSLNQEEKDEVKKRAEQIVDAAEATHLPVENTVNDVAFYAVIKKLLHENNCNAFTVPCFEVCATRELMRRKTTFCLTHSLLKDEGIPSACAGDVGSLIGIEMMMSLSKSAPYMGNTMVMDRDANLVRTLHDVPSRHMKGYDCELPIELASFTLSNWGTTMRYNFDLDKGETITAMGMSPDFKKMMIVTGTVDGCDNYLVPECKLAMRYAVSDAGKFYKYQQYIGHHFVVVYGDYKEQLLTLAELYGMESLLV